MQVFPYALQYILVHESSLLFHRTFPCSYPDHLPRFIGRANDRPPERVSHPHSGRYRDRTVMKIAMMLRAGYDPATSRYPRWMALRLYKTSYESGALTS